MATYDYNLRYDYSKVPMDYGKTDGKTSPTSNPISSSAFNFETSETPMEFSQRQVELAHIKQQYTTYQQARALQRATQEASQTGSTESSYITEYGQKLEELTPNVDGLSEEEYAETFKKLTGMDVSDYRQKKAENPNFRLDLGSVLETSTKSSHVQRRIDEQKFGQETVDQLQGEAITHKETELQEAKVNFQAERDKEGDISDGLDSIVEFLNTGTSRNDVKNELKISQENINELKKSAKDKDAFRVKFKEITGQEFKAENFVALHNSEEKFKNAAAANNLVECTKELGKPNSNYNLDSCENYLRAKAPEYSPLEKSLINIYKSDDDQKDNGISRNKKVVSWINNKAKELGVENADPKTKYEALEKSLLDEVETQKKESLGDKEFAQYEKEYKDSLRQAYGKNIPQETIDNYVTTKAVSHGIAKTAVIIGATVATGGAGLVAAGLTAGTSSMLYNTVEKGSDKNGLTFDDVKDSGKEAAEMTAYTLVGGVAAKAGVVTEIKTLGATASTAMKPNLAKQIARAANHTAEITTDCVGSYGVAKLSGTDVSLKEQGAISGASVLAPRFLSLAAGSKTTSIKKEIHSMAADVKKVADPYRQSAEEFTSKIAKQSGTHSSSRIKGDTGLGSLENKISNEMCASHQAELRSALLYHNADQAKSRVFDLYGTRFVAADQAGIDKIYDSVYSSIEKGEFIPEFINNYCGQGISPYFSKEQLEKLQNLCKQKGYNVKMPCLENGTGSVIYKDGYTSAHINGRIKVKNASGQESFMPTEIQIRTENVQETFDAIHIPYDVMEKGKDITSAMTQTQKDVATPIIERFKKLKSNPEEVARYYEYQTAYIKAQKENCPLPKPADFNLPDDVSVDNIIRINNMLHSKK